MKLLARSFCIALLTGLAAASSAHAELSDEIQVYTDDINEPGRFGLEMHVNTTPKGRATPDYPGEVVPNHGWRFTPEFSYGMSPNWEAGLYLPVSRDSSGNTQLAGAKLRLKWLPVKPSDGEAGWFFGANGELSRLKKRFSESRTSAELRLMGGWRNPDWLLAVNPVFGWNLSDGIRSATADVSLGIKVARTIGRDVGLGLEYYSDLGSTRRILPLNQQSNTLYAALDARVGGWDINFGIGWGVTRSADDLTVKAIIGVPF
ncbi:MAG TPA: hypothetical protein VFP68_08380 [Burkholderiaceae bacterium]|nr:hypothetical protein [Burkholderiaceae bacterium]